jgi:peptidoglycan/xylan/chitin deacetylase (PgdA/CDA1 family)
MMKTLRTIAVASAAVLASGAAWASCANPSALGVSRVIAVSPQITPVVGSADYHARLPLAPGEVVLTFDDGPNAAATPAILRALANECVRATFFMVGRQARAFPQIARQVAAGGHTVGTHTQNHPLGRPHGTRAVHEIDAGIASVAAALGRAPAPFFRFPGLYRTGESEQYLRQRGIMVWSVDVDSYDWKHNNTAVMLQSTVARLAARGGGILLMHDIKPRTAAVLPKLLAMLKAGALRVVHVVPRGGAPPTLVARSHQPASNVRLHSPNVTLDEPAGGRKRIAAQSHPCVCAEQFRVGVYGAP